MIKIILLLLLLIVSPSSAFAGEATLAWDAPTTNADGTPLTDLAGYKVYYGTSSRNYIQNKDVGNITTYRVLNLGEATWYFAATAYDTSGNESTFSNEVNKKITIAPSPPGGCRIVE